MRKETRRGFTLPEVLVTIAIVATLAAVLLPALNGQLSKGEASRVSNDLLALQTAVNTFVSDVRRYPASLVQLTRPITNQSDINTNPYPSTLAGKWKGPYLTKDLTGGKYPSGFGAEVQPALTKTEYNGINYVTVTLTPLPEEDFAKVDQIIDETASSSTGQFRWAAVSSGTASFYAVPIQ